MKAATLSCSAFSEDGVRVHHVPGFVKLEFDIALQFGWNRQVMHFVDAFVERRGEIEIAGVQEDFEIGVIFHRVGEIGHHVRGLRLRAGCARGLMEMNPRLPEFDFRLVFPVRGELQILAHVIIERGNVGGADRGCLRIVARFLAERVERGAGEARVEAAGGHIHIALERFLEFAAIDAQVGFLDVFDGQAGVLMQLRDDGLPLLGQRARNRPRVPRRIPSSRSARPP